MKYLDTVTTDIDRLKEARKNINIGVTFTLIWFTVFATISLILYSFLCEILAIWMLLFSTMYLILMIGLMIKREIYSMMIYLKEKK